MKKASVERDANTDDDQLSRADELGRNILALMEAHRARTAVPGAASPQLPASPAVPAAAPSQLPPPLARKGVPPTEGQPAPVGSRRTDLSDRVSPDAPSRMPDAKTDDDQLGRNIYALMEAHRARTAEPGAASPQLPLSPAVRGAASSHPPPWLAVSGAASPRLPPSARNGAPPTEGQPAPVSSRRTDLPDRDSPDAPPRMPMGIGGPNIEFRSLVGPRQHDGSFSISEARSRSSPESDVVPKPPVPMRGDAARWVGGLIVLFLVAGISAYGSMLISTSRDRTALVSPSDEPVTSKVAGAPAAGKQREQLAAIPRLIVEDRRAYVNEPLLLGLSLDGASGGEFLLIKGLDAATRLSAGTLIGPNSWRVSALDRDNLFVYAPKGYVGTMDAVVDLHTTDDRKVDSQRIRLEWIPAAFPGHADVPVSPDRPPVQAPPETFKLQPDEIAVLLQRGKDMLKFGDVSGARLFLRRAAEADNAEAALLLASTFDPIELRELGVMGFAPDLSQALAWYLKASALGSGEAQRRIERLGLNR